MGLEFLDPARAARCQHFEFDFSARPLARRVVLIPGATIQLLLEPDNYLIGQLLTEDDGLRLRRR